MRVAAVVWVVVFLGEGCPAEQAGDPPRRHEPEEPAPEPPPPPAPPPCDATLLNTPPSAPDVTAPAAGTIDVEPGMLVFSLATNGDADEDQIGAHDIELWRVKDDALDERVWRHEGGGTAPVSIGAGAWENQAAEALTLKPGKRYAVRARVMDTSGACNAWSAWSAEVRFRTEDGGTTLFSDTVRTFDITLPPASVDGINAEAPSPGCFQNPRTPYPGTLSVDGEVFEGVGVRIKGGCGSSRDLNGKPSLKITLDWDDPAVEGCGEGRKFLGQSSLTLNNGVQDQSALHERLGYQLYRAAGVPAPRVAHAWLRINGDDYGLYQLVETIDRDFLERWFEDARGMMYEGAYWCDLVGGVIPPQVSEAQSCFQREFHTSDCERTDPDADPTDWSVLQDLVTTLDALDRDGAFWPDITAVFDFDAFLTMWAVDASLAHWDGYPFHIINNYRVYRDPRTGLFHMFPWGIDQTFLGDLDPFSSSARMANDCMAAPECMAAFKAKLAEVSGLFAAQGFGAEVDRLVPMLEPLVEADPRREYDVGTWQWLVTDIHAWLDARPAQMLQRAQ